MKNQKGFIQIILVLGVMILVGVAYFFGTLKNKSGLDHDTDWWGKYSPFPLVSVQPSNDPTANWKTYTNKDYGFSFKYPPYLKYVNRIENANNINILSEMFTSDDYKTTQQAGLDNINIISGLLMTLNINKNGCQKNNFNSLSENMMVSKLDQLTINQTLFTLFHYDWGGQGSENVVFKIDEFCPVITITYGQNYNDDWKQIRDQILSTFQFTK